MIYETEEFEVNDVDGFARAFERFRGAFEGAGATEPQLFRHTREPNRVLAAVRWPDLESCQAFASEHESEFESTFGPVIVSAAPSEQWEPL